MLSTVVTERTLELLSRAVDGDVLVEVVGKGVDHGRGVPLPKMSLWASLVGDDLCVGPADLDAFGSADVLDGSHGTAEDGRRGGGGGNALAVAGGEECGDEQWRVRF